MAVYKRGEIWHIRFEKKPFGQIKQSSGSTRKTDALALETKIRADLQQRLLNGHLGKARSRSWDEAVIRWIESGAPDSWLPKIRQLRPYFDGSDLIDAPYIASEMKLELRKQKLSPCTINRRLAAVRRVLNLAYREWDWIDFPLAEKIKLESELGTEREVYLSREQFKLLFDSMLPERKGANIENVKIGLLLLVNTGLRESELLRLTAGDWRNPRLVVTKGKTGKPRSIPVHPVVHWICDEHLPIKVTRAQLRYWWDKGRDEAKLQHVRKHDLRHTFASWYADDPRATLQQLRDILGHSNLAVTSRYTHLLPGHEMPDSVGFNIAIGSE